MNFEVAFSQLLLWLPTIILSIFAIIFSLIAKRFVLHPKNIDISSSKWSRQLLMFFIVLIFIILLLLSLPISESMKGELFNLLGISLTATIALSSTTFVGNAMAGFMLKSIDSIRAGDFLKVGDFVGRVTEQGLLHTEIQTEDRDLTTLPNLYLVTTPLTVVRSSGTIVSATVSLGFDIPRAKVEKLLLIAGDKAGLKDPYVQILELGDFSVNYRIAGFLSDVKYLISFKSKLRGHMLDVLHENGVEIVSPNFMNQRVYPQDQSFIPKRMKATENISRAPEDIIFDKADEAESVERIREMIQDRLDKVVEIKNEIENNPDSNELKVSLKRTENRVIYLKKLLDSKEIK